MEYIFEDILEIKNGKNQKAVENPNGKYPIYGSGGVMGYADDYICEPDTVIIGRKGNINHPIYVDEAFWNVDTAFGLQAKREILNPRYLFYFCKRFDFEKLNKTVTIPSLTKSDLLKIKINLPETTEQFAIVEKLTKLEGIIDLRKQELNTFDNLIKARFVEMFGDPIINSENLPTMPMTEVCEIIDGDRGKNYPTADEFSDDGYCLFLNAKNVTASGFNFDNCMYVSKEKDEALRKGKLSRGDVVLTTRGTLGNLAFYTDEVPFENVRINSGMVILRMKQEVVDEVYFIEQFKLQLDDIKEKIASGSAQPQLPISTMNKIQVLIPDIDKQREFAEFIKQIDKSKIAVQKSLEETQTLFDSLMQEYFG
ncbi:MAG: restriction endonuclease subunit S [Lachnospiraceae bacterium]|nr:restriction endonuclease subunit S [Lachnospiraceae bacterium]